VGTHNRRREGQRAQHCGTGWLRHRRDERTRVVAAELGHVLLDAPERRLTHTSGPEVGPIEVDKCSMQGATLRVECQVNQDVVVEVHFAVEVEVSMVEQVRDDIGTTRTFQAFEMYVIQDVAPTEVSQRLGLHIDNVYRSNESVTQLLRQKLEEFRATQE